MKKLLLFVTMAAALLFTQCKKEDSVSSVGKTVRMTVTAGPGSKTDIASNGAITWSTGDKLYVGDGSKYIGCLTLVGEGGSATGVFSGDVTLPTDTKDGDKPTFHFFYLGSADYTASLKSNPTSVEVDFSSQNIAKRKSDEEPLQNASKYHVGYGTAEGTVTADGNVIDINVMLVSKVALARFNIKKGEVQYGEELTLSGDNICNVMTVGFNGSFAGKDDSTEGGISLAGSSDGDYYVMLVPTDATTTSQTLTFTGANVEGKATLDNIKPNQFYGKDTPIEVKLESTKVSVESVKLNKSSLSLEVGGTETLIATVAPDNATDKSVTWSSSATGVATVSNGVVTAVAAGTATITVTTNDGSKTAECTVTVTKPSYIPGTFSVSETKTVEFASGNLYYDGTADKWKFEANQWDFRTYNGNGSCIDGTYSKDSGTPTNDWGLFGWSGSSQSHYGKNTSTSNGDYSGSELKDWGGITGLPEAGENKKWHTLTKGEWDYLLNTRCSNSGSSLRAYVTLDNGVPGLVILPDGSSVTASGVDTKEEIASSGAVFLPASGNRDGTDVRSVGSYGGYWSGTPNGTGGAYRVRFSSGDAYTINYYRYFGYAVRLVR